jgi:hypothetical protein
MPARLAQDRKVIKALSDAGKPKASKVRRASRVSNERGGGGKSPMVSDERLGLMRVSIWGVGSCRLLSGGSELEARRTGGTIRCRGEAVADNEST